MTNEFIDLEQDLIRRVRAGKNNAILLIVQDKPCICINNVRFEAVEYSIVLEKKNGEKIFIRGGCSIKQPGSQEVYCLFMDDKGPEGNQVRFVLYKGDNVAASSNDTVTGHIYIAVKNGNSSKPHVVSFVIASDGDQICSSLVSDGDNNIFQYCRYSSMLISGGF